MRLFLYRKRKTIVYVLALTVGFIYAANIFGFFAARVERSFRKYKKQVI
jgi:hypothetical protein